MKKFIPTVVVALLVLFLGALYLQKSTPPITDGPEGVETSVTKVIDNTAPAVSDDPEKSLLQEGRAADPVADSDQENPAIDQPAGSAGDTGNLGQQLVDFSDLADRSNAILLRAGGIDPTRGPVTIPDELRFDPSGVSPDERIRYLVRFTGSVLEQWKKEVTALGGEIGDYVPNYTFIVAMTGEQREMVAALPFVQWVDFYHPAYKLSEGFKDDSLLSYAVRTRSRGEQADDASSPADAPDLIVSEAAPESGTSPVMVVVQTFSGGQLPYLQSLSESLEGVYVINKSDADKSRVIVEIPPGELGRVLPVLANASEVEWVEPFIPPTLNNDTMHWQVQSGKAGENPLWDRGLTGEGQIVGVGDTGLDADMVFFWDESQGLPTSLVNHNQRKVISYHDLAGNGDWDGHDHGTHVAGTIAGKSTGVNDQYNGVAYDAKLVIQDIGNGGSLTGIPGDLNTYFQQAYDDGARIHSNSWGSAVAGAYTSYSRDADEFMWNNRDFLIVFSAGNSGPDINTVGSPGTAKNVLTSGAGENPHSGYNQNDLAYFSSNGPTDDGRIKPTVTAPGHYLLSADNDGDVTTFNSSVRSMSGTSMSAPAHAGSATLVRQYFTDGYYPTGSGSTANGFVPSAALIKAVMVNSGEEISGEYVDGPIPGTGQGWGRIQLDKTLFFQGDGHNLFVADEGAGLNTGTEQPFTFSSNGTEPVKITLVWTDYYPSLSGAVQLVNDLDLVVSGPSGELLGNVFSGGISVVGGSGDRLNVVENVYIPVPEKGSYSVTVKGYNVPVGPQPFALVATGLSPASASGAVSLNRDYYAPGGTAVIGLSDRDLDVSTGIDSATVWVQSDIDSGREVTLTELAPESGTFSANVIVNEVVNVVEGSTLSVTYHDESTDAETSVSVTDEALIDGLAPTISGVVIDGVDEKSAVVSWSTDEVASGYVLYRKEGEGAWVDKVSGVEGLHHEVRMEGLDTGTVYEWLIRAVDRAGNVTTAFEGVPSTFSTDLELVAVADFVEQGNSLFQLSGGSNDAGENGSWHQSSTRSYSGTTSWYYGLDSTGTYNTGTHNWGHITTANGIDLNGLKNPALKFNHILVTEDYEPFDLAYVQVSLDNQQFTTLYESTLSVTDWEEVIVDLRDYADKVVYIRFGFDTLDELYNDYQGWNVDDIRIVGYRKKPGDINGDGKHTLADLLLTLNIMSGNEVAVPVIVESDVNGDGRLGMAEAISLLRELSEVSP